ncbi:MAG: CesT family type III secretion system chaperone [Rhabdochlamydiaceae bacterium]|nr:CesT family type III secretion system chaperone [Candidatus Amphrikana amoebophyrae]
MSLENAKANLEEFGKELNLEGLAFDENYTCILGIDNTFSLHLTFEPNSNRLYLYSPILDGLPKDDKIKLNLYEALLEGSMLGGQMAGGGCGVAVKEELILMHCVLEMGIGTDSSALRRFAPLFVEAVEKWRDRVQKILEGRDEGPSLTAPTTKPPSQQGGAPGAGPGGAVPGGGGGHRPGDFMKI